MEPLIYRRSRFVIVTSGRGKLATASGRLLWKLARTQTRRRFGFGLDATKSK